MTKHTPGPWFWNERYHGLCGPDGVEIMPFANYEGMWIPDYEPEGRANAAMIAASPDLYAVLKAIRTLGELACADAQGRHSFAGGKKPATKEVFQFPRHLLPELDAAIAKAEDKA